uniref:EGF-like domain-containing protein n=1 Tax=Magallana gigas TaxID=29159 RepID=A0A8W8NTN5_MAGGI
MEVPGCPEIDVFDKVRKYMYSIDPICDYGFHGLQCLKECSKFCKTTQDCHPVTGTCHGGCRSGWRGHDCLEVSTYQSQFIGFLVSFSIVLGAATEYFTMKRVKKYKEKQRVKDQSKASPKQRQDEQPNVYTNKTLDIDYQELGELKKPEIYDTVQQ